MEAWSKILVSEEVFVSNRGKEFVKYTELSIIISCLFMCSFNAIKNEQMYF